MRIYAFVRITIRVCRYNHMRMCAWSWLLKMAKSDGWSSSKLPRNCKERLWAFVFLLALGEKPPHFKFDVNPLKPAGVMVEKPLAEIMQMRSFWAFGSGLFSHYISATIVAAKLKLIHHEAHAQGSLLANWQGRRLAGTWVLTLSIWCLRICKMEVTLELASFFGK